MNVNRNITVINAHKRVFRGINFVLLPILVLIFSISLLVGYMKGDIIPSWSLLLKITGGIAIILLLFNFFFNSYKLMFDDEHIVYQHLLRKRQLKFADVNFARYEVGYEFSSQRNIPSNRFVLYPKSYLEQSPLVINVSPLASLEKLVSRLDSLGKLKAEKDFTE